ncbi:helix-turn-helix domain-containing protein [Lactococcus lactis]|jgi:transcriptional regulator with XRE-family HTH domain|uniref:helix-turn-helix domain-containing protein n=1 Tax=Lactococcus lactis TaxID=1358 RepID=UPI001455DDC5|nr:helix-turn-helix transcriptional regulator [Lactococcus lactis]MBR8673105.1 helix-turn-helix domain-containing protein [Lactococcus lactis subsp. lactis]MBR8675801.1 helix-turn-helix domain-containing protein [Lactococcus lactis subsp. lactis]MBR8683283.1 helix-turn-helix domain-containing protein [Lactococcus lactis subsp. lactis]MCH5423869.1 helix-turn-helix domain-containing protein [Lactococcus lactis]MCH5426197.1 helix-turn-helix domain-containing protein [Lactococcus lactis]
MTKFSTRLKELRKKKGLTQKELAEKIGIQQGGYTNWETGKREPKLETVVQLAKILEATTDYLLGFDDVNLFELNDEQLIDIQKEYTDFPLTPEEIRDEMINVYPEDSLRFKEYCKKIIKKHGIEKARSSIDFRDDDGKEDKYLKFIFESAIAELKKENENTLGTNSSKSDE